MTSRKIKDLELKIAMQTRYMELCVEKIVKLEMEIAALYGEIEKIKQQVSPS